MTVRAKQTQVRDAMIIANAVHVIELQHEFPSLPLCDAADRAYVV